MLFGICSAPSAAAHFNRFFLEQMETYFKSTLGQPTYDAMTTTDPTIPKGWLVFYALASACGKLDQKFSKRSHIVDICKARNTREFNESLPEAPPISDYPPPPKEDGRENNITPVGVKDDADPKARNMCVTCS